MYLDPSRTQSSEQNSEYPSRDLLSRPLRDLRLSVLDRCNLRCTYCMPADSLNGKGIFLPKGCLLVDQEITQLVRIFSQLGVNKVRLTGGEPLLRPGFTDLVSMIAEVGAITDLALTTNAILLPKFAESLFAAGLGRITVSLDSLDEAIFQRMSGGRGSVAEVLEGIEAAESAGFVSIKINTVVQRGVNDECVTDLIEHFRGTGHTVRLIEFMDVGNLNHWSQDQVVPSAELLKRIHELWPLRPVAQQGRGETARRYEYLDGAGEIGFISSISEPFCGDCSRARITADGVFYNCLFSSSGTELRSLLRSGIGQSELLEFIRSLWLSRDARYSEARDPLGRNRPKVEMFRVGG